MPVVEQTAIIKAPLALVMETLSRVETIPSWATVTGTISAIKGYGRGMSYEWQYTINGVNFRGQSRVMEQTEDTLITKTTGDVDSLWTITLTPAGKKSTAIRVVVEYTPPHTFVELLADILLQQFGDPEVAKENMKRFKAMVEQQAVVAQEQLVTNR
jgi:uncharacterized membrane protein